MFSVVEMPFSPWQAAQTSVALALPASMSAALRGVAIDAAMSSAIVVIVARIMPRSLESCSPLKAKAAVAHATAASIVDRLTSCS
jgi:hypothetical protein